MSLSKVWWLLVSLIISFDWSCIFENINYFIGRKCGRVNLVTAVFSSMTKTYQSFIGYCNVWTDNSVKIKKMPDITFHAIPRIYRGTRTTNSEPLVLDNHIKDIYFTEFCNARYGIGKYTHTHAWLLQQITTYIRFLCIEYVPTF